jgi:CheY-like chemotaxis protein
MRTGTNVELYVVLADDDIQDHVQLKEAIRDCGLNHIVSSVYTGRQLLDLLYHKNYYKTQYRNNADLIILCLSIQSINGWDALARIRADKEFDAVPIIALTTRLTEKSIEKAKASGVQKIYAKPVSKEEWKEIVSDACLFASVLKHSKTREHQ